MTKPIRSQRTKTETEDAMKAFDMYVKMGGKRSHEAVGKAMGRSKETVGRWATKYGWTKRIEDMQAEENERAHEKIKEQYFADADKVRDFKYKILDTLKEKFEKAHRCSACDQYRLSVGDMISILHVVKTELGEPTSITKNTIPNPGNDPFAIIISRLFPADAKNGAAA